MEHTPQPPFDKSMRTMAHGKSHAYFNGKYAPWVFLITLGA